MKTRAVVTMLVVACIALNANFASAKFGETAKPLSVKEWINGDPVDLAKDAGSHVFVVEFWATWCPPCRQSIPHLSELQKKHKNDGLIVVGVTDQDAETVKTFIKNFDSKVEYTIAIDDNNLNTQTRYMAEYGIEYIPAAFVINREGKVAWYGHPLDPEFEKAVMRALDAKPPRATSSTTSGPSSDNREKA